MKKDIILLTTAFPTIGTAFPTEHQKRNRFSKIKWSDLSNKCPVLCCINVSTTSLSSATGFAASLCIWKSGREANHVCACVKCAWLDVSFMFALGLVAAKLEVVPPFGLIKFALTLPTRSWQCSHLRGSTTLESCRPLLGFHPRWNSLRRWNRCNAAHRNCSSRGDRNELRDPWFENAELGDQDTYIIENLIAHETTPYYSKGESNYTFAYPIACPWPGLPDLVAYRAL